MQRRLSRDKPPTARFWFAAAIYLVAWSVAILTPAAEHDSLSLPLTISGSVLAGVIAGRWSALAFVVCIVPLTILQPCDPARFECMENLWIIALAVWTPLSAVLVAAGVGVSKLRRRGPRYGADAAA